MDRVPQERLRKGLQARYLGVEIDLCCFQQGGIGNDQPLQTVAFVCKDEETAKLIVPPEVWERRDRSGFPADANGDGWCVSELEGNLRVIHHARSRRF